MRKNIDGLEYNGSAHKYYWDISVNPVATIKACLADCTAFVYGACLEYGLPAPVSKVSEANQWHTLLINGWKAIPFDKSKVKVNDIIEWGKNHVAIVSDIIDGKIMISGSFYTGEHGKAYIDGKYDTRDSFKSLEEVSNFMIKNYRYRFFHYVDLDTESQWVGGQPEYILVAPNQSVMPVERNRYVDQIETTDRGLRIRTAPSLSATIHSSVQIGYYNVWATHEADGYVWYEIADGLWCANITTNFLKASDEDVAGELSKLVNALKDKVNALEKQNIELKEINTDIQVKLEKAEDKLKKIEGILNE